ncbi:hypothetical protein SLA2020_434450 [Shorea laevis]
MQRPFQKVHDTRGVRMAEETNLLGFIGVLTDTIHVRMDGVQETSCLQAVRMALRKSQILKRNVWTGRLLVRIG